MSLKEEFLQIKTYEEYETSERKIPKSCQGQRSIGAFR